MNQYLIGSSFDLSNFDSKNQYQSNKSKQMRVQSAKCPSSNYNSRENNIHIREAQFRQLEQDVVFAAQSYLHINGLVG